MSRGRRDEEDGISQFHETLGKEISALKDRVRLLVPRNNQASGSWREMIVRSVIQRHLPPTNGIGSGFVVTRNEQTTQLDLIVLNQGRPILFRADDLVVVTPDAVSALIEIKTRLRGQGKLRDAIFKLCRAGALVSAHSGKTPWLGLCVLEGRLRESMNLQKALRDSLHETGVALNCVSLGQDGFVRFWPFGEGEVGDRFLDTTPASWRIYDLQNLAISYFVGNAIDAVCGIPSGESGSPWFAYEEGKKRSMIEEVFPHGLE